MGYKMPPDRRMDGQELLHLLSVFGRGELSPAEYVGWDADAGSRLAGVGGMVSSEQKRYA